MKIFQLEQIGIYFRRQLLESRHRGAFELAYAGFIKMTFTLWRSPVRTAHCLPQKWLSELMSKVKVDDPDDRLCSTRRSAGVPFFVQAVVSTEPADASRRCFADVMSTLLQLAQLSTDDSQTYSTAQVRYTFSQSISQSLSDLLK